jgi:hypothetical protein
MMDITAQDIAERLFERRPYWKWDFKPTITLDGELKTFGKLSFDFTDEIISFTIWIGDRNKILVAADDAVKNFDYIMDKLMMEQL